MPQLFAQQDRQPDVWVMSGAPSATVVYLSLQTTINYSSGSPDTLPANTPAVIYGTSDTAFDRSLDVWVPFTVRASGVLSIIKESLLATLTVDYVAMARVEIHGIKPYQPEPYLAAGGLGAPPTTTTALLSAAGAHRVFGLGYTGAYASAPASWQTLAFDDSAWALSQLQTGEGPYYTAPTGAAFETANPTPSGLEYRFLLRASFVLGAGVPTGASLQLTADDQCNAAYLNGTLLTLSGSHAAGADPKGPATTALPAGLLVPGSANVLALDVQDGNLGGSSPAAVAFALLVQYGAVAPVADPGGHEGDLLYYHAGAWSDLPLGTSGQELTVVAGDPAWATPPAAYTDPLSTKGDLLTRSASATVRLGVGSDGQVVTADSTAADGLKWATPAASGVTSVALAGPTGTTVSGSPVTGSGTLTLSWASQSANTVLGAPDGSSGPPTFRVLASGDIPGLAATKITSGQLASARGGTGLDGSAAANGALLIGNGAGYTLATITAGSGVSISNSSGGIAIAATGSGGSVTSVALSMPGLFSVSGSPVTTSGTLSATLAVQAQATVFAGPAAGAAAAPTFRALQGSDLPAAAAAGGHIYAHGHFL